uniref:Uncharacterized protein n=1 Tax=Romanomermis culicivorax TaxID=13658 RepID=A0A915JKK4_ROMCU
VTSSSPIDIPSEQQQNLADRSSSAQQNITTKPLLSTSVTNLHLSGSVTNLNHSTSTGATAAGAASQSSSNPAPSEQSNLLQRHSVAGQSSASPNFDIASFLRQQSSANSFASSNGGHNQCLYNQPSTQASKAAHLSSSSFFSHDDDSSYFYK